MYFRVDLKAEIERGLDTVTRNKELESKIKVKIASKKETQNNM